VTAEPPTREPTPISDELAKLADEAETVGELRSAQGDYRAPDGEKLKLIARDLTSIVEQTDRCEIAVTPARYPVGTAPELVEDPRRIAEEAGFLVLEQDDDPHDPAKQDGLKLERIRSRLVAVVEQHGPPASQ